VALLMVPLLPAGGGWLAVTAPQLTPPITQVAAARVVSAPKLPSAPAAAMPGPNRPDTAHR
jgi:hypothetical protein